MNPDYLQYSPWPLASEILDNLKTSTHFTQTVINNLSKSQETVPLLSNVNPPLWEFGHLIWFHEFWVHRLGLESNPSLLPNADFLFNSSEIMHDVRWEVQLPSVNVLMSYFVQVMGQTFDILKSKAMTAKQAYFIQLALYHQDMHNEAFAYTWQHLKYALPITKPSEINFSLNDAKAEYIDVPSSILLLGSTANSGFIFDNEKWQHEVNVPLFSISNHAISNGEYLEFLMASKDSDVFLGANQPSHWKNDKGCWYERIFTEWRVMEMPAPVRHISALHAEQYCLWRGVRLPTEYELTTLLQSSPTNWHSSGLWEWTSSTFSPYDGFRPDPYQDYSAPWFNGEYRVLKGWSSFTPEYLRRPQFRNFYLPTRSDPYCGFRTCLE